MPTYQYTCTSCGEPLEAVQSFSDPALTDCPNCGGRLRKVYSAVGIVFKGSGFYRTDSRSAPAGAGAGKEAAGKDGGDGAKPSPKEAPKAKEPATSGSSGSSAASASTG